MDRSLDELIKENPKKFSLNKGRYQPRYVKRFCLLLYLSHLFSWFNELCLLLDPIKILVIILSKEVGLKHRRRTIMHIILVWPKMEEAVSQSKEANSQVENLFSKETTSLLWRLVQERLLLMPEINYWPTTGSRSLMPETDWLPWPKKLISARNFLPKSQIHWGNLLGWKQGQIKESKKLSEKLEKALWPEQQLAEQWKTS